MITVKSRNILMDYMKIFATIGVFIGHFMNTFFGDYVFDLRFNHVWIRSLFGYLFLGDYCVVFFFVASGFLLSYYWEDTNVLKRIVKYCIRLFVPTILIILINALVYLVISWFGDDSFNLYNIWDDIRKILFLKEGIYYGYQLWYIPVQVYGYTICSIIYASLISNTRKRKYILLIVAVFVFSIFDNSYAEIMLGVLCGSICKEYREKIRKIFGNVFAIILGIILFFLASNIMAMYGYSFNYMAYLARYVAAVAFAYILCISSCIESNSRCIAKISSYTFSMYLVHVLVLSIFQKMHNAFFSETSINIIWTIAIVITVILSSIAYKIIYDKVVMFVFKKIVICED